MLDLEDVLHLVHNNGAFIVIGEHGADQTAGGPLVFFEMIEAVSKERNHLILRLQDASDGSLLSDTNIASQATGPKPAAYPWLRGSQAGPERDTSNSPFVRLVRRSLATAMVEQTKAKILGGDYPYEKVLQLMVSEFARLAREDGQIPVVMLIQSRDPTDPDVFDIVRPVIEQDSIPYLATVEHFDPRDVSGFLIDDHYVGDVDQLFAEHF